MTTQEENAAESAAVICEQRAATISNPRFACCKQTAEELARTIRHQRELGTDGKNRTAEYEANARLIAAAPEMLEALEEILETIMSNHFAKDYLSGEQKRKARAAIQKVRGQ